MQFNQAQEIAQNLVDVLSPFCDKIHIAGSIRRKKEFVKDIEIVCQIKRISSTDLFSDSLQTIHPDFYKSLKTFGNIERGHEGGKYMKIVLHSGIALDLFTPADFDYYRQLAIRTGPAEYSENVIAMGWRKRGWVGTPDGLRLESQCIKVGTKWKCIVPDPELPPEWKSEEDFFEWLNVDYQIPEERSKYNI